MTGDLNIQLFQWIHARAGHQPIVDGIAIFFAEGGPYLLGLLFIFFWFFSDAERKVALLEATEAGVVGLLLNQLIGLFYFHPRPYMAGMGPPLIPHGPETSFPSDHTTLLLAAACYILLAKRWYAPGGLALVIGCLTGWGRVYSGIHFPLDLVGSLAVGLACTCMIKRLAVWLRPLNDRFLSVYIVMAAGLASLKHLSGRNR